MPRKWDFIFRNGSQITDVVAGASPIKEEGDIGRARRQMVKRELQGQERLQSTRTKETVYGQRPGSQANTWMIDACCMPD